MARKNDGIAFIVEYEDGRTAHMTIDRWTLRTGDHVAIVVAGEQQRGGRLPAGKIARVKRAPGN